jgi:ATP-binding cassette, sub-family E, member 1
MRRTQGKFVLDVDGGSFTNSEIIVLLGENGSGKTTLIRMLAGDPKCQPDDKTIEVNIY